MVNELQRALDEVIAQDNKDHDQLSEVDNAYNTGWQAGTAQVIGNLMLISQAYTVVSGDMEIRDMELWEKVLDEVDDEVQQKLKEMNE